MAVNINTMQYWDNRFENNWQQMRGSEQTVFFADIAVQLMPDWLKDQITNERMTICDFGCALGQAVDYLYHVFQTDMTGVDFSLNAIRQAKKKYPQYRFEQFDIESDYDYELQFDVGYISNVLEHITKPWQAAKNIVHYLKKYLVILIPFRETLEIEEHCNRFDLDSIPLNIEGFRLIYTAYKDCAEIKDTSYADKQILLIYSSFEQQHEAINLDSLVKNFEDAVVDKFDALQQENINLTSKLSEVSDANTELVLLNNQYLNQNTELNRIIADKDGLLKKADKTINEFEININNLNLVIRENKKTIQKQEKEITELKAKINTQTLDSDYMKNMIYNLQVENERIKKTVSWRITKPLRGIGRLANSVKRILQDHKLFFVGIRQSKTYKKYLKNFVPRKIKDFLMKKYFTTQEDLLLFDNNDQERCVLDALTDFEKRLKDDDQVILVFSGVKYIDSEGQRNIRFIHEARKLGRKIVFAYWRWNTKEDLEAFEENMVKIPIDILAAKQVYIFETFFKSIKDKCLLVEFPHPYVTQIIEIANAFGWKTVYDVIDDWEEFAKCGQAEWYRNDVERRVSNIVDMNVATAYLLRDKIQSNLVEKKPFYVISNGVDPSRIKKTPRLSEYDFTKGSLQIGYFGHLTDAWFDWEMLKNIAQKHDDWTFHLIGYGAPDNLKLPANMILYGKKIPEELPKYAAYWDVAIIPFINNDLTRAVNPIKVFEYLQLRLPVVVSDMPEITNYPYVTTAIGADAFEKAIEDAINIKMDDAEVQEFIEKNTWKNKSIELLNCVDKIEKMW